MTPKIQENADSGPTSLPAFRRDAELRKQQSLVHDCQGPKSLHSNQQDKVAGVVPPLQRATSVGGNKAEEPINQEDCVQQNADGQPEWLKLAQKKREKRELKEKSDNVTSNNQTNVHETNNKNQEVSV